MKVLIIIGSDSDWPVMKPAAETLKQFGVEAEVDAQKQRIRFAYD